jgi:hypothetical protein
MKSDATAALFVLLGQAADKTVATMEDVVPKESLLLSGDYDLAPIVPEKLEAQEEVKSWMALGSRDKSALMTLPQLLKVIDHA